MKMRLAFLVAFCMMFSLTSCKKASPGPDPSSASTSSSAPTTHIDSIEDGPGEDGFYTPSASSEMTTDDITPVKRTPATWAEYTAENPGAGEGYALPNPAHLDSQNWELYAIAGKGGSKYPLVGAKSDSTAYDDTTTKTAARGLNVELTKASTSALFEAKLAEGTPMGELMMEDWEEDFRPNFQRQKSYDGHRSDTLRTYMQDGTGIFYGENTYDVSNGHSFMRRLNLNIYIDYGNKTIVRIQLEEKKVASSVEDLDTWASEIHLMANDILTQYGKMGLEDTVLGPDAMIADFIFP